MMEALAKKPVVSDPAPAPVEPIPEPALPAPRPTEEQKRAVRPKGPCILFACGCKVGVKLLESGRCDACAKKVRIARNKEKTQKMFAKPGPPVFRLPAGTEKHLTWNGTNWTGTMTVPASSGSFRAVGDTEKQCLHALHAEYVKSRSGFNPCATGW
jgi:hypothetical protein